MVKNRRFAPFCTSFFGPSAVQTRFFILPVNSQRLRAKAFYSLEYGNGIENYVVFHEESPEEIYERKLTMQQLNEALAKLPIKQGQHIYSRYFLGKSCKEIALAEHVTPRTIQITLQRGLKRLGKLLKELY